MSTSRQPLQSWTLVDLEDARLDAAAAIGGKLLEAALPDGAEGTAEVVKAGLLGTNTQPDVAGLARLTARALAWPIERLARPKRLDLSIGDMLCVRQAARFDLVELLMRAQSELGRKDLCLVPPGITFAEACHRYCWPGLLIAFYPAARGSGLHQHYLGLDRRPDPAIPARSTLRFTVVDTAVRPC